MSNAIYFKASDDRVVAMLIRHDFDAFASFPPTFDTQEEREWLQTYYNVRSPELEKNTKAHLTTDELPLQITVLNRPANAYVKPHYHINEKAPDTETRHQVMICMSGSVEIGIYAKEGEHIDTVTLHDGDFILLYEGHSIKTMEDGTRLIEIKQGPMPEKPFSDNVSIDIESK